MPQDSAPCCYFKLMLHMIRKIILLAAAVSFSIIPLDAQNTQSFKKIVKDLSSSRYQGRGYARDGVLKAGRYIEKKFHEAGADEVMLQPFTIDINTFPGRMSMRADGRKLEPGRDFVMREFSPGAKGRYNLYYVDTLDYDSERIFLDLSKPENKDCFVVCDFWFTYKHSADFRRLEKDGGADNAGVVYVWDTPLKFYKAYGEKVADKPIIWVSPDFPSGTETIDLDIENEFLEKYESNNVIAKVSGERHDSCYVFTAHYDHLGNLGKRLYYPGANDNASGTAGIITLAEHYAANRPEFDMYFIAFSGEDANLRGSTWFAEHPVMPLKNIRYLFNLDMICDNNPVQYCEVSDAGMRDFPLFEKINGEQGCFKSLNRGELAANSDHYPFAVRGVPCIFFENEQGDAFKYYHTPQDNFRTARYETYEPLFRLLTTFISLYSPVASSSASR